jgi:Protein of unknown function (DUF3175)
MAKPKRTPKKRAAKVARPQAKNRWSQQVTEHSDALVLEPNVFTLNDPEEIAASLKRSAERSRRRKSDPYRSAMSMLTFYVNRAGANLPAKRRRTLERTKAALRKAFGRSESRECHKAAASDPEGLTLHLR